MKKLSKLFLTFICLQLSLVPAWPGGIHFGMSGAVQSKIKELDEKVRAKEVVTTTERSPLLAKYEPADGKALLIIGQDKSAHDQYIADIGNPAGLMFYTSVQQLQGIIIPSGTDGGTWDFPVSFAAYPNMVIQIGLWMSGTTGSEDDLDRIDSGVYDANLDMLGNWMKNLARPVFLRVGYEFDNPSFNYNAEKYVRAYKHVVDHFRAQGVTNVAYVWHSWAQSNSTAAINWYPGDSYVDWVGISFFLTRYSVYMDHIAAIAIEHNKPLMIAESTPLGIGTLSGQSSWDSWFKPFFDFVTAKKVKAISYINWDWEMIPMFQGQGWGNCRIQNNVIVKGNWTTEVTQSKYLHSSSILYNELGY